jgi:Holliday junction resolvase RusA-like endonuclease
VISFTVLGEAKPAGSKTAFVNPKTGKAIVTDASKGAKPWQAEVKAAASEAMKGNEPFVGPLHAHFKFFRARPTSHYGTGRNAGEVKLSAPFAPATRPDVLKLARAVEDALTGIVYRDDAQIIGEWVEKRYGSPRCEIEVWPA